MISRYFISCWIGCTLLALSGCDRKESGGDTATPRTAAPAPQPSKPKDPRQSFESFASRFCAAAKPGLQVDLRHNFEGLFRSTDKSFKSDDLSLELRDYTPVDLDVLKTDSLVHPHEGRFTVNFMMTIEVKSLNEKKQMGPIKHQFRFDEQDDQWVLKEYIGGNKTAVTGTPEWVRAAHQAGNGQ
jgi:hypothetical protein